jgi:hypothetical protein
MSAIVWPLLIYWLVLYVACYTACEVGQDQFYDEVTPNVGLKVAAGSLILAALATWIRPSFDTMFTIVDSASGDRLVPGLHVHP